MADRILLIDDATGRTKRGPPLGGFTDEEFDVGGGGQTQFTLAATIDGSTKIDVYTNGVKRREGSGNSWERNVTPARIDFSESQPENAWILVRVWG